MTASGPPESFPALRDAIGLRHPALPRRLAEVARYAVDHPEEMAFGTAASIAEASGVQPSTLVRFAQAFGYGGFSDLQAVFRKRMRAQTASYDERLAAARLGGDGPPALSIAAGILDSAARSVERLLGALDGERLEAAAALLAGADTIYVLAQRRSYPAAAYLGYVFGKLRMRAHVAGAPSGIDEDVLALAGPADVGLSISFTPYAATTLGWTRILRDNGVPVLGITDSAFSPVASLSAVWLEVAEPDFEGFRALSATMALSASLAVAAAKMRRDRKG